VNQLRVLIANERQDRLADVVGVVAGMGHEVLAPEIEVSEVGPVTAREQPDVAFHRRRPSGMANSIEIVLRRFADYRDLEGAFKRRAITERAKGILMERHGLDEERAFEMLREHARRTQTRLVDTAQSIVDGHLLLPKRP
jgi:response regulator NasT